MDSGRGAVAMGVEQIERERADDRSQVKSDTAIAPAALGSQPVDLASLNAEMADPWHVDESNRLTIQARKDSGTWGTAEVQVLGSIDNVTWTVLKTLTGIGLTKDIDVTDYTFIQIRVSTVEGAAGVGRFFGYGKVNHHPFENRISSLNSTTSLLGADAVFTGTAEDVTGYTTASVSVFGTNSLATGTMAFQVSSDNVNFSTISRVIPDIQFDIPHMWLIAEKYFRVKYTNDSVAQTGSFRIQTMFSNGRPMDLANTLESTVGLTNGVSLVRNINTADLDLARRLVTGQRAFFFFGHNDAVGTSYEDIHPNGGDVNWLTTATKVEVLSSDAADTSAGLGVRSVEIHGLSATGADQSEVIAMNGTSAVESSLTYIRINKMHNETVGTYGGSHKGDVTCQVTGGGSVLSVMIGEEGSVDTSVQYGLGEASNGYWSVPLGKVLYIADLTVDISTSGNKTADVILYEREGILDTSAPMDPRRVIWSVVGAQGEVKKSFKSHIKIKQLTDLFFRAKGSASVEIAVSLDFYLLDQNASGA